MHLLACLTSYSNSFIFWWRTSSSLKGICSSKDVCWDSHQKGSKYWDHGYRLFIKKGANSFCQRCIFIKDLFKFVLFWQLASEDLFGFVIVILALLVFWHSSRLTYRYRAAFVVQNNLDHFPLLTFCCLFYVLINLCLFWGMICQFTLHCL